MKNRTAIEGLIQQLKMEIVEREQILAQELNKELYDHEKIEGLKMEIHRNKSGIDALLWSLT